MLVHECSHLLFLLPLTQSHSDGDVNARFNLLVIPDQCYCEYSSTPYSYKQTGIFWLELHYLELYASITSLFSSLISSLTWLGEFQKWLNTGSKCGIELQTLHKVFCDGLQIL